MVSSVLITGGAGFLGTALAGRLIEQGLRVSALDSLHPQVHRGRSRPASLPRSVELHVADVTDADAWRGPLRRARPDVVIHLAAETGTAQSLVPTTRHGMANVIGTTVLLDALHAADLRPDHIVVASSRAVYGEGAWRDSAGVIFYPGPRSHGHLAAGRWDPVAPDGEAIAPVPHRAETTVAQPSSVYGATKLAQEHLLTAWGAASGVRISVLRFQNVYGPGQSLTNPYTGVLALFARLVLERRAIDVYEDGRILRDFVYIDDAVTALEAAVHHPPAVRRCHDIGGGHPTTVYSVATTMAALAGAPPPVITGRFRDGDVRAASADLDAAANELGYRPTWGLDSGLAALMEWVADQSALAAACTQVRTLGASAP